jgi:hypothetical protein
VGLFTAILTLPLAPVRGTIAVAEQLRQQAMRELYDPARIRHQLELVARLRASGQMSGEEADAAEEMLIERLLVSRSQQGWRS